MKKTCTVAVFLVLLLGLALPLAGSPAAAKTIELKFATSFPPMHTMQRAVFEPWAAKLAEKTGGKVKVTFFPGGALGKPGDHYSLVESGIADIVYILQDYTPGRVPVTTVFELPFMGDAAVDFATAMWKTYEKYPAFQKEYSAVKVLALWAHPAGRFFTSKKPVEKLDDLKGMKMRTANPFVTEALKEFGAAPVSMPVTEVYTALERGVVDGTVLPYEGIWVFKLAELVNYASSLDFYTMTMTVLMNQKKFDSLPDDVKQAIEESTGMAMSLACGKAFDGAEAALKGKCLEKGVKVVDMPAAEAAKFHDLAGPLRQKWVKDMSAKGVPAQDILDYATGLLKK